MCFALVIHCIKRLKAMHSESSPQSFRYLPDGVKHLQKSQSGVWGRLLEKDAKIT